MCVCVWVCVFVKWCRSLKSWKCLILNFLMSRVYRVAYLFALTKAQSAALRPRSRDRALVRATYLFLVTKSINVSNKFVFMNNNFHFTNCTLRLQLCQKTEWVAYHLRIQCNCMTVHFIFILFGDRKYSCR